MSKYVGFGCRIWGVWSLFYAASTGSLNLSAGGKIKRPVEES